MADPVLQRMFNALRNSKCGIPPIVCKPCPAGLNARAFFESPPSINLCVDNLQSVDDAIAVLPHELMHAYDHCVTEVDLREASQLACSEIRACKQSECKNAFFRKLCVKRCAVACVKNLAPDNAAAVVKSSMQKCYDDEAPFNNS
eukprot:GILK01011714.1.p1 GENE.GILK01011714.1~~GILK01011714.1.p1  ORF type:complete len:164 (+),score=20.86 GILK01011714.1:60-494(+)